MSKRRFSKTERAAIYIASGGKCSNCGCILGGDWHADHIEPYSKGGDTDVLNGQALCPSCNWKKSNRSIPLISYRIWQDEQFERFITTQDKWFMVVATPGAGKSIAMTRNTDYCMKNGIADKVIIVTPSDSLKTQWKSVFKLFGYNLVRDFSGYFNDHENDGIIVTYQQIASSPDIVKSFFRQRRVVSILDEPHHMGDRLSWGKQAKYVIGASVRGILGSGTPFRSDNNFIPFVEYDTTGKLLVHYQYSYADALVDEVVRAIFFRRVNADAEWVSYNDEIIAANFDDDLTERQAKELLNLIIEADSDWVEKALMQAINDIRHIRQYEQPNAAILIACKDTRHASAIALKYYELAGVDPVVVSSHNDHENADAITRFSDSDHECIISVDMISEGVDIPRLRALVYATNKTTRLYFEQLHGRIVRVEKGRELANGLSYLPPHKDLMRYAAEMQTSRDYVIEMMDRPPVDPDYRMPDEFRNDDVYDGEIIDIDSKREYREYDLLYLEARLDGGIYGDDLFTEQYLNEVRDWRQLKGYRIPIEEAAKIYRNEIMATRSDEIAPPVIVKADPEEKRAQLRRECSSHAFRISKLNDCSVKSVHGTWMSRNGGSLQSDATIEELERKLIWLREWRRRLES